MTEPIKVLPFSPYPPARHEQTADAFAVGDADAMSVKRNGYAGQTDTAGQRALDLHPHVARELNDTSECLQKDNKRVNDNMSKLLETNPESSKAEPGIKFKNNEWSRFIYEDKAKTKFNEARAADALSPGSEKDIRQSRIKVAESNHASASSPAQPGCVSDEECQIFPRAAEDKLNEARAADAPSPGSEKDIRQSRIKVAESNHASASSPAQPGCVSDEEHQIFLRVVEDKLNEARAAIAVSPHSEKEIWQSLIEVIDTVGKEYLNVYETVVERYTSFYSDFSDFMSGMSAYFYSTTDEKGNQTMQHKPEIIGEIDKLINTYANTAKGVLFPASGTATKVDAEKWAAQLGLDPSCVRPQGGGFVVRLDLSPLQEIRKTLNETGIKAMTHAEHQAWRSGYEAQTNKFQTSLQTLTTKYGNANGLYDNIVKVLSSAITAGIETLKQILAST